MLAQPTHATQIKELVDYLKDLRLKCYSLQEQLPEHRSHLSKYDQLQASALAKMKDLNDLTFFECRTDLAQDELLEIRSHLSLIKIKKAQRYEVAPLTALPANADIKRGEQYEAQSSREKPKIDSRPTKIPRVYNDIRHNELMQIWKSGKHTQSAGDAVDRLNKLVIDLTCKYNSNKGKVRTIVKDEHCEMPKIHMFTLPQFCHVLEELERYKMLTEELLMKNETLREELLKVRAEIFLSKYRPRYYQINKKDFGCGTDEILINTNKISQLVIQNKINDRWSDEVENIKNSIQNTFRKTTYLLQQSKDSLSETLLLDTEESLSKLTYSGSDTSSQIAPDPNICKELTTNLQMTTQIPPHNIIKLGSKR